MPALPGAPGCACVPPALPPRRGQDARASCPRSLVRGCPALVGGGRTGVPPALSRPRCPLVEGKMPALPAHAPWCVWERGRPALVVWLCAWERGRPALVVWLYIWEYGRPARHRAHAGTLLALIGRHVPLRVNRYGFDVFMLLSVLRAWSR